MDGNPSFLGQALVAVGTVTSLVGGAALFFRGKKNNGKAKHEASSAPPATETRPPEPRDWNAIYQKNRIVAWVREPDIDEAGKEVRFGEIYNSDDLMLADECEFQKFVIIVRRIAYAAREKPPNRRRLLRGVLAEIVGYREQ